MSGNELSMESMLGAEMDKRIRQHHVQTLRQLGGVPCESKGNMMDKARYEVGLLIRQSDTEQTEQTADTIAMANSVLELLSVLNAQSHTDHAVMADVVLKFSTLAMGRPLTPLTGEDSEWFAQEGIEVNIRDSRIVRKEGVSYFTQGTAFESGDRLIFDGEKSWTEIEFPLDVSKLKTVMQKN